MVKPDPLAVFLFLLTSQILLFPSSTAVSNDELEAAIHSLRSRGYHLFGNAITSSDVFFDLLSSSSSSSFTLFAPADAFLFSLNMLFSASTYVDALRHHIALGRHSLPSLQSLIPNTSISTLLSSDEIVISFGKSVGAIAVDGVDIGLPGLFYGENLAVHGLAGILTDRTVHKSEPSAPIIQPRYAQRALEMDHALMGFRSPKLASESACPVRNRRARGSPKVSPAMKPTAMLTIAAEASNSSSAAAPAAISCGWGSCGDFKDLQWSPASDAAVERCESRGNQRSNPLFGDDGRN